MNITRRSFTRISLLSSTVALTGMSSRASQDPLYPDFPQINRQQVRAVVSAAHSNYEEVKALVTNQPELSRAAWDWGFGDFESALGAAAHMGRRDIAELLLKHGARPDIFTFTMLGALPAVRSMVEALPGVQQTFGPHGITLLQHAKNRLRHKDLTPSDKAAVEEVLHYLMELGDADPQELSLEWPDHEKEILLGDYQVVDTDVYLEIKPNMRNIPSIARKGEFGRAMRKIAKNKFGIFGSPGIRIELEGENIPERRLLITGLGRAITAVKV